MTASPFASAKAPRARSCVAPEPFIFSTVRLARSQSAALWPWASFISLAQSTKKARVSSSSGALARSWAAVARASRSEPKVPRPSLASAAAIAWLTAAPVFARRKSLPVQKYPAGVEPARIPK